MKLRSISTLLALLGVFVAHAQVPSQINYQGRVAAGGVNFTGSGKFKFALVDGGFNSHFAPSGAYAFTDPGTGAITFIAGSGGYGYTVAPTVTITGANGSGSGATAIAVLQGGGGGGGGPFGVDRLELTNPGSGYQSPVTVTVSAPPPNIVNTTYWSNDGTSNNGSEPTAAVTIPVVNGLYSLGIGDTALTNMNALPASAFDYPDVRLRVWFDDGTATGSQLLSPDSRLATVPYAFRADSVPAEAITSAQLASRSVTAEKLANRSVDVQNIKAGDTSPEVGQVLSYTAEGLSWVTAAGMTLPFSNAVSGPLQGPVAGPMFYVKTTSVLGSGIKGESLSGDGVVGLSSSESLSGVYGENLSGGSGVYGKAGTSGTGVFGSSFSTAVGVKGLSVGNDGVVGETFSDAKAGVFGTSTLGNGVAGFSSGTARSGVFGFTGEADAFGGSFQNSHANGVALKSFGKADIDGTLTVHNTAKVRVLQIDAGADIAEPFAMRGEAEHPPGSVLVISDERVGELQLSHAEYDTRVAGVISGANGINTGIQLTQPGVNDIGGQPVALSGRVYVRADASFGAIKPGDLLTTSTNPGHARKATDRTRTPGAVLGKAMSALDEGTGFVLVLVTLQ